MHRVDLEPRPLFRGSRDVLLDAEMDTLPGQLLPFTHIYRNPIRPIFSTPHYHRRWEMFSYLPLKFGSCYTSGLTVYWVDCIIKGMASHGPGGQYTSIGQRSSNAMHFPLAPEEFFTTFWFRPSDHIARFGLAYFPFVLTVRIC